MSEPDTPVPEDYDEYSVGDVRTAVREVDDAARLDAWFDYEAAHADRKTAKEAIADRLGSLTDTEQPAAEDGREELVGMEAYHAADEDAEVGRDGVRRIVVKNRKKGPNAVAGHTFGRGETRTVRVTPELKKALRSGYLSKVSDHSR